MKCANLVCAIIMAFGLFGHTGVAQAQPAIQPGGGKRPADSTTIYGVVVDGAASALVVGLFDGRPSVQDIAEVTLRDKLAVYAEVKKPDGNILLYKPF